MVGGYRQGDEVVIYAGTPDQLLSVTVSEADFNALREAISAAMRPLLAALLGLLLYAAPASAAEQLLTLYSPPIDSPLYVHRTETVEPRPDGKAAPAQPGYILGFQEMALVDSKRPDAKLLPVDKMMVHHFLYYAGGRVDAGRAAAWAAGSSVDAGRSTRTGASTRPGRRSSERATASTTPRASAARRRGRCRRWS